MLNHSESNQPDCWWAADAKQFYSKDVYHLGGIALQQTDKSG